MCVCVQVVFAQALAACVSAFASRATLACATALPDVEWWRTVQQCGFLIAFESLLSTRGSELGMLEDMEIGVRSLARVAFCVHVSVADCEPRIGSVLEIVEESHGRWRKWLRTMRSDELPLERDDGGLIVHLSLQCRTGAPFHLRGSHSPVW